MPKSVLLILLLALPATAREFGEFVPLTNTRYVPAVADKVVMATDGAEPFVFTAARNTIRMGRVAASVPQTAQVVLDRTNHDPAVTWTGTHFLVVATAKEGGIVGALVERNGTILRSRFRIADGSRPRIASGSQSVMLVCTGQTGIRAVGLDKSGNPRTERFLWGNSWDFVVASNGDGFVALTAYSLTVFGPNGEFRSSVGHQAGTVIALASDGRDYVLIAYRDYGTRAVRVSAAGTFGTFFSLGRPQILFGALSWSVGGYTLVYRTPEPNALVAYLDRDGSPLGDRTDAPLPPNSQYSTVAVNGRLFAATFAYETKPVVREFGGTETFETSYAAADQSLTSTASSSLGTLFLWRESDALHLGFRSLAGEWSEEVLPSTMSSGTVVSDGHAFLLLTQIGNSWQVLSVSETGRLIAKSVSLLPTRTHTITDIAWDGHRFIAAGFEYGLNRGVFVMPIEPSLSPGQPKVVRRLDQTLSIVTLASDGKGTLLVWNEPALATRSYFAMRLDHDLNGEAAIHLADFESVTVGLASTGSDYIFAWQDGQTIRYSRIRSDGKLAESGVEVTPPMDRPLWRVGFSVSALQGQVAIGWFDRDSAGGVMSRLAVVGESGVSLSTREPTLLSRQWVVPVGDRIASVIARSELWAPHHGGTRLLLAIEEDEQLPDPPAPPQLHAAATREGVFQLEWSAPQDPVNGFRIESRVEGAAWKELERWLGSRNRSLIVHLRDPEARTAFRIRAINDSGMSEYSDEVVVNAQRRRAVR